MNKCVLGFDNNSRSFYDSCNKTHQEKSSQDAGNYSFGPTITSNPHQAANLSLSQPNIHIHHGGGWMGHQGKSVDIDSKFRNAKNLTNTKEIHQLNREQYFSVPYLARGPGNPCVESILRPGEDTGQRKSCNSLAKDDMIDRRFHPLVSSLRDIQDPSHIIPEHVNSNWRRGGQSSREMLRNPKVLSQMGYKHNGKYWQHK
jgi:hypothetical protein